MGQTEKEPLHPKENPVIQGYLLPEVHGTYRRYVLELLLVLGLLLPWIGPLFGLAVMTPIVLLTVQNGKIITTERDCFGGNVKAVQCPSESYFDYYFWNITNPTEFVSGVAPPALQEIGPYVFLVKETRWNVAFSSDFNSVNYSSLNSQSYVPEASCAGCSLTNDYLVTVNRGYLAFLNSPLVQQNDALAFIPSVPLAIRQIVAGIEAVFIAGGAPPAYAPGLAVSQWGRAAYGYPSPPNPRSPEFAAWLVSSLGFSQAAASSILTDSQSSTLLAMFAGNPAADTPAQLDGALNVELFAFYPAAAVQGILAASVPSLGLTTGQIQLIQGYLYWVCRYFIVPTALFGGPTGDALGPSAGGLLVRRSVFDWINGWPDPLVKQNISLTFAWPANDTAAALFGRPTELLSWRDSPLIFQYSISTGRSRGKEPYDALAYDEQGNVVAYPSVPLPHGSIPIRGSAGGLSFPMNVRPDSVFTLFDATFGRPLNVSYTGSKLQTKGISVWNFALVEQDVYGCSAFSSPERCVYPDQYNGTYNATLTYACPTVLSFPHYYKADPRLVYSTGNSFSPNAEQHEWRFSIEPVTGYTLTGNKGYQINHLVKRSTFLYPDLWLNASSDLGGMWLPTFWARSRFEPTAASARALNNGLELRGSFRTYPAYVVPAVFGFLLSLAALLLRFTPKAKRRMAEAACLVQSKARPHELNSAEQNAVCQIGDIEHGDFQGSRSSIIRLEEKYGSFWSSSESTSSPRSSDFTPRSFDDASALLPNPCQRQS